MSAAADVAPSTARASLGGGRRVKYIVMLGVLVGSLLALGASTQPWLTVRLTTDAEHVAPIVVQGSTASPALAALGVAGLALTLALAIAGRVIRVVLALLGMLVGVSVVLSSTGVTGTPIAAASGSITTATGITGSRPVARLVHAIALSPWPGVAIAGGVILVVASVAVIVTSHRWPGPSKRYSSVRFEPVEDGADQGVDAAGRGVDAAGQGVDGKGRVVDAVGRVVDDAGRGVDAAGAAGTDEAGEPTAGAGAGVGGGAAGSGGGTGAADGRADSPRPTAADGETAARDAAIDSWDELSRGGDPTR